MINLYLLCADLKNQNSTFRNKSNFIITKVYDFLNTPSKKTESIIKGWKEDFRYIYGDVSTNLSSNQKLNKSRLLQDYSINVEQESQAEAVQMLFFSIQTYFSLLIKLVTKNILQGKKRIDCSANELILGDFFRKQGILNYCAPDWYCWPIFELENGFDDIIFDIEQSIYNYDSVNTIEEFALNNNYDYIKQIYEAIIPKELRHALGEYYTPDWLAEHTLKNAINNFDECKRNELSIIDPTCGSGTFIFKSIILKRHQGCDLDKILNTVYGIDINPLAVLTAKTNYIMSIVDMLKPNANITIPIYNADVIHIGEETGEYVVCDFVADPINAVKNQLLLENIAASNMAQKDIVVGNPPWVNWEYMPEEYRQKSQHLWLEYNLFSAKGRDLSFSKEDISVLITYIVMDKLLKSKGVIAFVIRQGVFKSAQNGVGFRRFKIKDNENIKVIKVEDLSKIRAFDNATNSTALFFARKDNQTIYPVEYLLWEKRKDIKKYSFNAYSQLQEVIGQTSIELQSAMPAVKSDPTSIWVTAKADGLANMEKFLGTNTYRARTGVFTGGANAVYWLNINSKNDSLVSVTNITERAKRKSEKLTANMETTYVYPMLKGSNIKKWNVSYDTYLLCPHTAETKMWPVSEDVLIQESPNTYAYLKHFKFDLDGRKGFAGWEKEIQQQQFHAILRVGDYTFSKYKVVWKYIASEFISAVISTVPDKYLGEKLLMPNEKVMYISTDNELEAYYICGILSSTKISECIKSYMNPTSISAHVLNKLNIETYDPNNALHNQIALICKDGHNHKDIKEYIERIDELVEQIYGV